MSKVFQVLPCPLCGSGVGVWSMLNVRRMDQPRPYCRDYAVGCLGTNDYRCNCGTGFREGLTVTELVQRWNDGVGLIAGGREVKRNSPCGQTMILDVPDYFLYPSEV